MDAIPKFITGSRLRNNRPLLHALDTGSPAALVLMMRAARRAVAEDPSEARVYATLYSACNTLWNEQEEYWVNYAGDPHFAGGLRRAIRNVQIYTALRTYLELHPDDYRMQDLMGQMFLQRNLLTSQSALDHWQQSLHYLDQHYQKLSEPKSRDYTKAQIDAMTKKVKALADEVKNRHDTFLLGVTSKKGAVDKALYALSLGLAKDAVEQLRMKDNEVHPKIQGGERDYLSARALLLTSVRRMQRDRHHRQDGAKFRTISSGLRMPPPSAMKATWDRAPGRKLQEPNKMARWPPDAVAGRDTIACAESKPEPTAQMPYLSLRRSTVGLLELQRTMDRLAQPDWRNVLTLRRHHGPGEQGDTATAKKHLEDAWQWIGHDVTFDDRPIVERYLELLREAEK